jgi:hypothetical protein
MLVMTLMAVTSVLCLQRIDAAGPAAAIETETSEQSGNAGVYGDAGASGGSYVRLGGLNLSGVSPATDAPDWTNIFSRVGKSRGWIGGDGGASVHLPDGRIMFVYADTIIGTVSADKSVDPFWQFIHNSLVTTNTDGSNFTTYAGGTTGHESAYIPSPPVRPSDHLWPYTALVDSNKVYVLANEWQPDASGPFGYTYTGNTWVVQLALPSLTIEKTTQIISDDQVQWGSTSYQDSSYNYIFGHLDNNAPNITTYLYRTPRGHMTDSIEYRTANGWSNTRADAVPVSNVDVEAITQTKSGQYQALFMDNQFPKYVREATAATLAGPWTVADTNVFTLPEANTNGLLEYMPRIHTGLSTNQGYVMSYSVNAADLNSVIAHAPYYQPHFFTGPPQ